MCWFYCRKLHRVVQGQWISLRLIRTPDLKRVCETECDDFDIRLVCERKGDRKTPAGVVIQSN